MRADTFRNPSRAPSAAAGILPAPRSLPSAQIKEQHFACASLIKPDALSTRRSGIVLCILLCTYIIILYGHAPNTNKCTHCYCRNVIVCYCRKELLLSRNNCTPFSLTVRRLKDHYIGNTFGPEILWLGSNFRPSSPERRPLPQRVNKTNIYSSLHLYIISYINVKNE